MTMNNPLDVLRAFSPTAQGVTQQFQAGQVSEGNRLANQQQAALNPLLLDQQRLQNQTNQFNLDQAQQGIVSNQETLKSQANIQNTAANLTRLNTALGQGATAEQISILLQQNIQRAQAQGGDGADSMEALQVLQQGGIDALKNLAGQATAVFEQQGVLKAPPAAVSPFAKINPREFTRESVGAFQDSGQASDLIPVNPEVVDPEWRKELRTELRTNIGKLETQAGVLNANFGKITELSEEIKKGNRFAVPQLIVAMVKLGDPGSVVSGQEIQGALNAENPTAALAAVLQGKGVSGSVINSILTKIDPTNPDSIDVNELLSTAEALLAPNAKSISDQYNSSKSRGTEQLTGGGFNSIYSESRDKTFSDLGGLSFGVETVVEETTVANQPLVSPGGVQFTVE